MRQKFIIAFIFFTLKISAQNCNCNQANILENTFKSQLSRLEYDSAKVTLVKIEKFKNPECIALLSRLSSELFFTLGEINAAKRFLINEKDFLSSYNCNQNLIIDNYNSLGKIYFQIDKLDSAVFYYMKLIDLSEKTNDPKLLANVYSDLAGTFGKMKQVEKAIEYLKKAISLNEKNNNYFSLAKNYSVLCTAYSAIFNRADTSKLYFDSAFYAVDKSIFYSKKSNNINILLGSYQKKAGFFIFLKDFKLAEKYIDSCIINCKKGIHESILLSAYNKKAEMYFRNKEYNQAKICVDSSVFYATKLRAIGSLADNYGLIYRIYKETGDFKRAMEAQEKMFLYNDSLNTKFRTEKINELEQKYNKSQNEKTITELNQQKIIAERESRIRTNLFIGITIISLLSILIVLFFYRQTILKNKLKSVEAEQRLNRARMDPHFFFNALSSIQTLSMDVENYPKVSNLISQFSKIIRQSLESTYDELISVEEEVSFLNNYLNLQNMRFPDKFDFSVIVDAAIEQDELKIPGMLLQPFIENSIEHGFKNIDYKGNINIVFKTENDHLTITLIDNGKGLHQNDSTKKYPSRATQIIHDRLFIIEKKYKSKAKFEIKQNQNNGISVKVFLPLIYVAK